MSIGSSNEWTLSRTQPSTLIDNMPKRDLIFKKPIMNAAGVLGFAPDFHAPVPWEHLGAFVTNPVSLRARTVTTSPVLIEFAGGFLLHTGLPNPGFHAVLKKHLRRWADSPLPIIVHLMADRPEETKQMVQTLEGKDNVLAVELGFAPLLADDIIFLAIEMCLGELPLIISLPPEQVLDLGMRILEAGAAAISLGAPRGTLPPTSDTFLRKNDQEIEEFITGRLFGPTLFPRSLNTVNVASKLGYPVIAAGGIYTEDQAQTMLAAGAMAVQIDAGLWLPKV
jgi:dihydroorotate dehydrogenase (NAD+) catalytic subunit